MVLNQATLKRDGVQDFVSLRTTALVITAYAIFIIGYFYRRLKSLSKHGKACFQT